MKALRRKTGLIVRKILHGKDWESAHNEWVVPSEIKTSFSGYAESKEHLSEQGFQKFVHDCQKETKNAALSEFHPLTLEKFMEYLLDPEKNLAIETEVRQDMRRPLSNYYIWTGHNSYLTGNQLSSDSGTEPIRRALLKGVRVIELDIWPDSAGEKIIVLHGRTMTKPVPFKECINTIKEYAFKASEYPVIITLEDHLKPELQKKAAKIVTKAFGEKLFRLENIEEPLKTFPSPEECKGLVLISTKPPVKKAGIHENAPDASQKSNRRRSLGSSSSMKRSESEPNEWGPELQSSQMAADADEAERSNRSSVGEDDEDDGDEGEKEEHYLRMISIKGGKIASKDYESALRTQKEEVQRVSLSETALGKVTKQYPDDLIKFTQRNLLRIFPAGSRIDSSNYNPTRAWLHGAQMAAFNMQGYGRPLWLMDGFFKANGGCGYVLKPDALLNGKALTKQPSEEDSEVSEPPRLILKVRVLMGTGWLETFGKDHFDRFSAPDFYVRVGVAGASDDSSMQRTETVQNRWNPVWKDNSFEFPLTVPEISVLRFECHDHNDNARNDFAGQTALPISELRQGYRVVPLKDKKGDILYPKEKPETDKKGDVLHPKENPKPLTPVRLLCHFSITTP